MLDRVETRELSCPLKFELAVVFFWPPVPFNVPPLLSLEVEAGAPFKVPLAFPGGASLGPLDPLTVPVLPAPDPDNP